MTALIAVFAALCSMQAALAQDSRFPPVPFYDWTGGYVGVNLGYASATINETTSVDGSTSGTLAGVIGGGQVGANLQYNHTVFGIEVDADATAQRPSSNSAVVASLPSFATARARVGYAYDRIHLFVSGGAGYAQFSNSGTTTAPIATTGTTRRTAWVAGAGSESAVTSNIILRFEFLYLQLLNTSETPQSTVPAISGERVYNLIGRVGLSYKFGWAY